MKRLFVAIAFASFGVLTTEVALTRIFSFAISYHFAYLTIATALLGFGSAGALLAVRPRLFGDPDNRLVWAGGWGGLSTVLALGYASVVRFNPFQISQSAGSAALLASYYLVVAVPFVLSGLFVVTILSMRPSKVGQLYAADLIGAGAGCAAAVPLIWRVQTPAAVVAGALALGTAALCIAAGNRRQLVRATGFLVATALVGGLVVAYGPFPPSPGKFLSLFLKSPGAHHLYEQWTPLSRVDAVGWTKTEDSWKSSYAVSGVSPQFKGRGPEFRMIGYDGGSFAVMYQYDGSPGSLDVFRHHLMAAPYKLESNPKTLIIGLGGGADALAGLANGVGEMTGVELNPVTVDLGVNRYRKFNGGIFSDGTVKVVNAEGRHWVDSDSARYDLIVLNSIDTLSALSTGAYVLAESYLYTREAFRSYLEHLDKDGMFALYSFDNFGVAGPTYIILRFVSTFDAALRDMGVKDPASYIAVLAGPGTTPLVATLVKARPYTQGEIDRLADFAEREGFHFWHRPYRAVDHQVSRFLFADPAARKDFIAGHYLRLDAATDNSPFFFNFYKWGSLLFRHADDPGTTPATGQRMLMLMVVQAVLISLAMILWPLRSLDRGARVRKPLGFILYFAALGFGFILLEISLLQRFVLFLGFPTYSLSVVLFCLLTFTGIGSALSTRIHGSPQRAIVWLAVLLALVVFALSMTLPALFDAYLKEALSLRIALTILVFAPLGVILGMFFPLGIRVIEPIDTRLVPWAWGINGCTSVVGTITAVMLAMAYGFDDVMLLAVAVYITGALALSYQNRSPAPHAVRVVEPVESMGAVGASGIAATNTAVDEPL